MINVCISETPMPAAARTAISTLGCAVGDGAFSGPAARRPTPSNATR
jgi:hypothetical protein